MVTLHGAISLFQKNSVSLETSDWTFRVVLFLSLALPDPDLPGA
jgi:hypothetical protein